MMVKNLETVPIKRMETIIIINPKEVQKDNKIANCDGVVFLECNLKNFCKYCEKYCSGW